MPPPLERLPADAQRRIVAACDRFERLKGRIGNDVLDGGGDEDRVVGGLGSDVLRGGNGPYTAADFSPADSGGRGTGARRISSPGCEARPGSSPPL